MEFIYDVMLAEEFNNFLLPILFLNSAMYKFHFNGYFIYKEILSNLINYYDY